MPKNFNNFEETLSFIDRFCKEHKFEYAVIGGVAVINYNSYRTTNDIDITIRVELDDLQKLGEVLISSFKPIFKNAIDFFEKNYVLPAVYENNGIRIDFTAAISGFDRAAIKRGKRTKLGNTEFSVCSIEDLILYKLVASRYQDLSDIEQLLKNNISVDKKYLLEKAEEFGELGRSDVLDTLNKFL